jgi:hypothetical protein
MHPKDQSTLAQDMLSIVRLFEKNNIDYALCGGFAVAIHGYVRMTQDIDFIILPEDLERAKECLEKINYNLPSGMLPFKQPDGSFRQIIRINKAVQQDLYTVDLMLCEGSLKQAWEDRKLVSIGEQTLKVVSKTSLITMKKEAGRSKDLLDVVELESHETP